MRNVMVVNPFSITPWGVRRDWNQWEEVRARSGVSLSYSGDDCEGVPRMQKWVRTPVRVV